MAISLSSFQAEDKKIKNYKKAKNPLKQKGFCFFIVHGDY